LARTPKPEFISQAEFARRLGINKSTVSRALQQERISLIPDGEHKGKLQWPECRDQFERTKDEAKSRTQTNANPIPTPANSIDDENLVEKRKKYLDEQIRQKKRLNDLEDQKVVFADIAYDILFKGSRLLRDNIYQIYPRVIPIWAGQIQNEIIKNLKGVPEQYHHIILQNINTGLLESISRQLWTEESTRILEELQNVFTEENLHK
jgi:transcriptional regulator with XRE-family HTH domain